MSDRRTSEADPECRDLFARLSEYIDGELPEDVCSRFDRHIADCAPCVRFVESLRRAVRLVEAEGATGLPDDLRRDILEAAGRLRRG